MDAAAAVLFALALSLDGFLVGMAYGIKRIEVPFISLGVIAGVSMLALFTTMAAGRALSRWIASAWLSYAGAGILLGLGVYYWLEAWRRFVSGFCAQETVVRLKLKFLGVIIQVLAEPEQADRDASGAISFREAWLLGGALSVDSLAAGFGLAFSGNHIILTALMAGALQFVLVRLGHWGGARLRGKRLRQAAPFLSGCIFAFLALSRLAGA
jgi:putative sporulation protein YtaF